LRERPDPWLDSIERCDLNRFGQLHEVNGILNRFARDFLRSKVGS
jgi:hypothetical protein